MNTCLFCPADGPYSTVEHIIPESLGNDDLVLKEVVCDSCQNYFGREVEKFVLSKTPFAFWRAFLGIRTKNRQNPSVDLSQPKKQKGVFPSVHPEHDAIGFTYHEDGSVSVEIHDSSIIREMLDGTQNQFRCVFTPKVLSMIGRFLCKVGVELLCLANSALARSESLATAQRYARYGEFNGLWPIFHFSKGSVRDYKQVTPDESGFIEKVRCYSYSMVEFENRYLLFLFSIGTDNWVICLNDPFPDPTIRSIFPDVELNLIWYENGEWKR